MLNPEKPVRFARLMVGDSGDNWFGGLTQIPGPIDGLKCFGFWLKEGEALAFCSWMNAMNGSDLYRAFGDDWLVYDFDGEFERELPKIVINGELFYDVSVDGLMLYEVDTTDIEFALNILTGYCREIPGMNVRDIDWWIATFGAERLGAFYAEKKAKNETASVGYLDHLLLALVK